MFADDYSRRYDDLYSNALANLTSDCLEKDPADRPAIQNLRKRVGRGFRVWNREHGSMTRELPMELGWKRVCFRDDEFELGRRLARNRHRDLNEADMGSGSFF